MQPGLRGARSRRAAYNRPMGSRYLTKAVIAAVLGLGVAACEPPPTEPAELDGRWRGELLSPGGALPFGLEFDRGADGQLQAWLLNGAERARIREVRREGDQLQLAMPALGSVIRANISERVISGQLQLTRPGGAQQLLPFSARRGDWRFFPEPAPVTVDFSGRWAVEFDGNGESSPAVAEFTQDRGRVTGTFITPTGDYRFLEGEVRERELFLSTFGGGHAFLFRARMDDAGELTGDFWSALHWHDTWIARRDDDASLPDPTTMTPLADADELFDFSFPDLDGENITLQDYYFDDKVVIVTIGGSWCPNCHDEAAFLAPWYRENAGRGVAIVGLMYEHFGDFARAAAAVGELRDEYGIDYPLLIAGISDKDEAAATLPMIEEIIAYPTTIFLDRERRIRRVHTGFLGPGTGEYFERWQDEFRTFMNELLAEEPA